VVAGLVFFDCITSHVSPALWLPVAFSCIFPFLPFFFGVVFFFFFGCCVWFVWGVWFGFGWGFCWWVVFFGLFLFFFLGWFFVFFFPFFWVFGVWGCCWGFWFWVGGCFFFFWVVWWGVFWGFFGFFLSFPFSFCDVLNGAPAGRSKSRSGCTAFESARREFQLSIPLSLLFSGRWEIGTRGLRLGFLPFWRVPYHPEAFADKFWSSGFLPLSSLATFFFSLRGVPQHVPDAWLLTSRGRRGPLLACRVGEFLALLLPPLRRFLWLFLVSDDLWLDVSGRRSNG